MKVYELIAVLMEAPAGMDVLLRGSDDYRVSTSMAEYDKDSEVVLISTDEITFATDED